MSEKSKIVAICGSPRRGNTYEILRMLQHSRPEVECNIRMLSEMHLEDCLGCYTCSNAGEQHCPLDDDRDRIIAAMQRADGVVFASPTYARTLSALMKKFAERTSFMAHRPSFFGKYAMVLTTCAGMDGQRTTRYLSEHFGQYGFATVSSAVLKMATKSENETEFNKMLALGAYQELLGAIASKKAFQPTFGQLVYFNIFKGIAELNKARGMADYNYYKDKADFYYDLPIPALKNNLAKWIAGRELKKFRANR